MQIAGDCEAVAAVVAGPADDPNGTVRVAVNIGEPLDEGLRGAVHQVAGLEVFVVGGEFVPILGLFGGQNFHL